MAHGYLSDWDEGWGRSDERERGDRDWRERERNRDRDWSGGERPSAFSFGDRDRRSDLDRGRGEWDRSRRNFRSHPDDHYLSWRDKQIDALDRDYADYCREREQQFHQDFDSWRSQRHGNHQPLRTGMTQTGPSKDPSGELELTNEATDNKEIEPDSMSAATLGTTSGRRSR
jgi:hypothetical protein